MKTTTVTALSLALLSLAAPLRAHAQHEANKPAEPLLYARLYADAAGVSHFADEEISFELVENAPPLPSFSISTPAGAEGITFLSASPGSDAYQHPTPTRQFVLVLSGDWEIEASDGEVRSFGPGSLILFEDTVGQGHTSRVMGSAPGYLALVPLTTQR